MIFCLLCCQNLSMASAESINSNSCAYFVPRKKRHCKMTVKSGKRFCGEHAVFEKDDIIIEEENNAARMPCPYDPNHSCYVSLLEKHLKRCNSKPQPNPEYITKNINVYDPSVEDELKITLGSLSDEELMQFIERIYKIHKDLVGTLPNSVGHHKTLESTLSGLKESRGSWRHVYQNSSILYNMDEANILQSGDESTYVEFGSGRGHLSYVIGQVIDLKTDSLLMIDKSSPRHKHENRYKINGVSNASIQRIRANIADVELSQVPQIKSTKSIIGVGKHLCGAATDMALHSLYHASTKMETSVVKGVCIALCCHHQCTWRHYVGKSFFKKVGLDQRDFAILKAMTSWAVCGARNQDPRSVKEPEEHEEPSKDDVVALPRYAALGLDADKREEIGRQCKQVIDQGRVSYLSGWPKSPLQARLVFYVEKDISPENVLLLASLNP